MIHMTYCDVTRARTIENRSDVCRLLIRPPAHKVTKEPLFAEGSEDHVIIKHTSFSFSFVCLCFSYRVKRLAYRGYFWYQTLVDLITFECVDRILRCERSNESYCEVLFVNSTFK